MNIFQFWLKTNNRFVILILGVRVEESNHHLFGEKLVSDINNPKNELNFKYLSIKDEDEIDYSEIESISRDGLVITSDCYLEPEYVDFTIYVDTPLNVLSSRGLVEGYQKESEDEFKSLFRINKYINDYKGRYFSINKIYNSTPYDKLWDVIIELVCKNIGIEHCSEIKI